MSIWHVKEELHCPKCKSCNISTEKRPGGNYTCLKCGHCWPCYHYHETPLGANLTSFVDILNILLACDYDNFAKLLAHKVKVPEGIVDHPETVVGEDDMMSVLGLMNSLLMHLGIRDKVIVCIDMDTDKVLGFSVRPDKPLVKEVDR